MAMDPTGFDLPAVRAAAPAGPGRNRDAERAQLKLLAQEFEALLMNEMLGSWRESLMSSSGNEESDHGMGTMVDMVGAEFGRALSRSGGLGIAAQLLKAFDRQIVDVTDSPTTASEPISSQGVNPDAVHRRVAQTGASARLERAVQAALTPAARSALVEPAGSANEVLAEEIKPIEGAVTSAFGWRRDPLNGQVRFHAGADIRMAYGKEVTSVAAGRVSFVGEQGGYGLTVVVDHADGLQTRYAHLSSLSVNAGETVSPGQAIARSGTSGRSTAPHLHVELLSQGRPTDPSTVLKGVKGSADWKEYRSAVARSAHESAIGDQE